ncbi:uncharacterized protein LOC132735403 [Ruditapes philippinarum]|uniref:uncharacterized protein LOC132735403 n=1 Tax=Ruditapes philippinarum TaxID=129788 RepID=UPI00295B5DBE|nr:uncharacterized protein LOC132735403 [Ruditapes philippinarum]
MSTAVQVCYVEEEIDIGGEIVVNAGCREKTKCDAIGCFGDENKIRKRSANQTSVGIHSGQLDRDIVCHHCCDGDFCNMYGCPDSYEASFTVSPPKHPPLYHVTEISAICMVVLIHVSRRCVVYCLPAQTFSLLARDGDFCNMYGCPDSFDVSHLPGSRCFVCDHVLQPEYCNVIKNCEAGYSCGKEIMSFGSGIRYTLLCIRTQVRFMSILFGVGIFHSGSRQ